MSETLGLMLVRADKITRAQLYEALREQRKNPGARLGDILFAKGWIGEDDVTMLIAKQIDVPFIDSMSISKLPAGIATSIPKKVAQEYRVIPVKLAKGRLTIAMEDQKTRNYIDELSYLVGTTCVPALATPKAIRDALHRLYGIETAAAAVHHKRDIVEKRPAEKLEELPVASTDAKGRAVASMKNSAGEEQVYLLTEVAPELVRVVDAAELAPVDDEDLTVHIRTNPTAAPKPKPVPPIADGGEDDEDRTRILPRAAKPPAAKKPEPTPADDEPHDNFLATDAKDDDRPMFTPKTVAKAKPVPVPATAPPPKPEAPEPHASASADPDPDDTLHGFDIVHAAEKLFECATPEEIGDVVVRFARNLVDRAMLFDLPGARYRCIATTDGLEEEHRGKDYAHEDLVLLGVIAQNRQPAYGPTPNGEMYDKFFDTLGMMRPPVILLYPLIVGGKTRAVLYSGLGAMRPPEEFGDLQLLFKEAGTALEILAG